MTLTTPEKVEALVLAALKANKPDPALGTATRREDGAFEIQVDGFVMEAQPHAEAWSLKIGSSIGRHRNIHDATQVALADITRRSAPCGQTLVS